MQILAFDLAAYKFGFAIGDASTKRIARCGKVEVGIDHDAKIISEHERSMALMVRVLKLIRTQAPGMVICEDTRVAFGSNTGLQDYYTKGNLRYLELFCAQIGTPFKWISISGWKGKLFGKAYKKRFQEMAEAEGKKKINIKQQAVKQIKLLYPDLRVDDDDAAEATALIHSLFF